MKYEFLKDWGARKKGEKVDSDKKACEHLVKLKVLKKIEPKVQSRKKKVEPGLETRKKK